jgi:hypothetical protein
MRPSPRHSCGPSSPVVLGPRLPILLAAGVFTLLAGGPIAPAARAGDKPASFATVSPAVQLGTQQLADIAAKGVPNAPAPVLAIPLSSAGNLRTVGPPTGLGRIVARENPARASRIFGALGPIPRESWIRRALGKRDDFAVIGGLTVRIKTDGEPR